MNVSLHMPPVCLVQMEFKGGAISLDNGVTDEKSCKFLCEFWEQKQDIVRAAHGS